MVTKTFGSTMLVEGTRIGVRTPPGLFRHIILYIVDLSLSQPVCWPFSAGDRRGALILEAGVVS